MHPNWLNRWIKIDILNNNQRWEYGDWNCQNGKHRHQVPICRNTYYKAKTKTTQTKQPDHPIANSAYYPTILPRGPYCLLEFGELRTWWGLPPVWGKWMGENLICDLLDSNLQRNRVSICRSWRYFSCPRGGMYDRKVVIDWYFNLAREIHHLVSARPTIFYLPPV